MWNEDYVADDEDLFLKVIDQMAKGGVLTGIVLIGSWVLPIYRMYFNNVPEIPVLTATDVDFLVGMPPRVRREFDVPSELPKGWQQKIRDSAREHFPRLLELIPMN